MTKQPAKKPKRTRGQNKTLEKLYNEDFPVFPLVLDYDPKFHPAQFVLFCQQGKTPSEICAQWGMSSRKLQQWIVNCETFKEAFRIGREAFFAYYDDMAKKMMTGQMFFPQAKIFEKFVMRYCNWRDDALNPFDELLMEDSVELEIVYKDVSSDPKTET